MFLENLEDVRLCDEGFSLANCVKQKFKSMFTSPRVLKLQPLTPAAFSLPVCASWGSISHSWSFLQFEKLNELLFQTCTWSRQQDIHS